MTIETMREYHVPYPDSIGRATECKDCGQHWPCEVAICLVVIDRLRAEIVDLNHEIDVEYGIVPAGAALEGKPYKEEK
jgi:hypothetical protein